MDWTTRATGLRIGGHRGAPDAAPENTFAGFEGHDVARAEFPPFAGMFEADR